MSGPLRRPQTAFRPERLVVFDPAEPPAAVTACPRAGRLLTLWRGWAAGRAAPDWSDVEPIDMPDLLPKLVVLDVLGDGVLADDFRFRLVGEGVNERYGHGLKGRTLRELMRGPALDETLDEHRRCAEGLAGVFVRNSLEVATLDDRRFYGRLLLPVGVEHGRAQKIMGVMEFFGPDAAEAA
jgi:hypothetical protein